jgi:hypothetical protein
MLAASCQSRGIFAIVYKRPMAVPFGVCTTSAMKLSRSVTIYYKIMPFRDWITARLWRNVGKVIRFGHNHRGRALPLLAAVQGVGCCVHESRRFSQCVNTVLPPHAKVYQMVQICLPDVAVT